jgi:predicted permease
MKGLAPERPYAVAVPVAWRGWLEDRPQVLEQRSFWWLHILGRLKPGTSLTAADARMRALAPEVFRAAVPGDWTPAVQQRFKSQTLELVPASTGFSDVRERYRAALYALMAIVSLVLLIACCNIANLLLARSAARQRELAMRKALGANRRRLVRQLLTESLLLSSFGAFGGLAVALVGGRLLVGLLATSREAVQIDLAPDFRVLAFTAAVAAATVLLFGLVPALRATRVDAGHTLTRAAVGGHGRSRLGNSLVAAQIAVSFVLLLAAGLLVGTLRNLTQTQLGFRPDGILLVNLDVRHAAPEPERRAALYEEIQERLRRLPGVTGVSATLFAPLGEGAWNQWSTPGGEGVEPRPAALLWMNGAAPGYFQTLGTALIAGRDFSPLDSPAAPAVMVVNQTAARQFFGAVSPLGKVIRMGQGVGEKSYQVVGVVQDAKYNRVDQPAPPTGFVALGQSARPEPDRTFIVRHAGSLQALTPSVRATIAELSPETTVDFRAFKTRVDDALQQQRVTAVLASLFGALALLLSMVGLYGVTAYSVARRRGEIGLRMALGARSGAVIWLIMRHVAGLLAIGTALGALGAWSSGRLLANLLYGVEPNDPARMLGSAALLGVATALAAGLPAWRATQLDPMRVLREE